MTDKEYTLLDSSRTIGKDLLAEEREDGNWLRMRPIKSKVKEPAALGRHSMHGDQRKHALAALKTIEPVGVLVCMNQCARHPAHDGLRMQSSQCGRLRGRSLLEIKLVIWC